MPTAPNVGTQTANFGQAFSVTLPVGTGGDPPLSYSATGLPSWASFNTGTRVLSGTPDAVGSSTVTYTVTDNDGDSDSDTFTLDVNATIPQAPTGLVATPGDGEIALAWQQNGNGGRPLTAQSVHYQRAGQGVQQMTVAVTATSVTLTGLENGEEYLVFVRVTNSVGSANSATIMTTPEVVVVLTLQSLTIGNNEDARILITVGASDEWYNAGSGVGSIEGDADLPPVIGRIRRLTGLILNRLGGDTGSLSAYINANQGKSIFVLVAGTDTLYENPVSDASGGDSYFTMPVVSYAAVTPGDMALMVFADAGSVQIAGEEPPAPVASFTSAVDELAVQFTDTSTGTPTSWAWAFGDGATSTQQSPSHTYASAGTRTVTLTATNAGGSDSFSAQVTTTAADLTPTVPMVADQSGTVGTAFTATLPTGTGGNTPLAYSVSGLPSWASFNTTTRLLSGTPDAVATTIVTYTVTDDDGDTDSAMFDIVIAATPDLTPTAPAVNNQSGTVGTVFSTTLPVGTGGDSPLSYAVSGLPSWASFNTGTRVLSGTPDAAATTTITYTVSDDDGDSDDTTFDIIVAAAGTGLTLQSLTTGTNEDARLLVTVGTSSEWYNDATGVGSIETNDADLPPVIGRIRVTQTQFLLSRSAGESETFAVYRSNNPNKSIFILIDGFALETFTVSGAGSAGTSFILWIIGAGSNIPDVPTGTTVLIVFADTGSVQISGGTPDLTPTAPTVSNQTGVVGTALSTTLPVGTGGDAPLAYSVSGLPSWASFATATRLLSGTPDAAATTTVTYTVTDDDGDSDDTTFDIIIAAADLDPSAPTVAAQSGVVGTAFIVTLPVGTGGDPPLTYSVSGEPSWASFNTGTRVLSGTPDAAATTTVTYTVTDDDGDTDSATFDIDITAADTTPVLAAVVDQAGQTGVLFNVTLPAATGGNPPVTYAVSGRPAWLAFNAGTRVLSGTPNAAATSTLTYTATDDDGDAATRMFDVVITTAPPPAPDASFTRVVSDLTVAFTDTSTNTPTGWAWAFGDGATSTQQSPSHTYASASTYTVTLTATNGGGSDTFTASVTTTDPLPPPPVAAFTSAASNLAVQFTDASTGAPASWAWTFGDGATSSQQSPSHTYASARTYTVTLTATNTGGSNTFTASVTTSAPPPSAPVAAFTSAVNNLRVRFTDTSTGAPISWLWSFGDGATSTQQSPSHTYASAGTRTVTLTATNTGGSDSASAQVTTTALAPVAAFTHTVSNLRVRFTDTSSNTPTGWAWTFGDGNSSTLQNPVHDYASAGTYTVTLTATNTGGSDSATAQATTTDPPPVTSLSAAYAASAGAVAGRREALWLEALDAAGNVFDAAPVTSVSVQDTLDQTGSVQVALPATARRTLERAASLALRDSNGEMLRHCFITDMTRGRAPGSDSLSLTAFDDLAELQRVNTLPGAFLNTSGMTAVQTIEQLCRRAGWGSNPVNAVDRVAALDLSATSVLSAVQDVCDATGMHFRLGLGQRVLEFGQLGESVAELPLDARLSDSRVVNRNEIANWIVPFAGDTRYAVTLRNTTRRDPYPVERIARGARTGLAYPAWAMYDEASIARYGRIEASPEPDLLFNLTSGVDGVHLSRVADSLYDWAAAWLARNAVAITHRSARFAGSNQRLRIGDKVTLPDTGEQHFIVGITRNWTLSSIETTVELSNVNERLITAEQVLARRLLRRQAVIPRQVDLTLARDSDEMLITNSSDVLELIVNLPDGTFDIAQASLIIERFDVNAPASVRVSIDGRDIGVSIFDGPLAGLLFEHEIDELVSANGGDHFIRISAGNATGNLAALATVTAATLV